MVKEKIINFFVLIVIFLLTLSLLRIFYIYYQQKIYVSAQNSRSCLYLKWQGTLPNYGTIPQSLNDSNEVVASPIKVNAGIVTIEGIANPILRVIGTSSLDVVSSSKICLSGVCRSNWSTGESGSNYWLLNPSQNFLYPSSSNWSVSIGTSSLAFAIPTSSLYVMGRVISQGGFLGTINAVNVSAGTFGSSTGGGNFSFPAYVSIGTTTIPMGTAFDSNPSLKVAGTVQANRVCIGEVCYGNWPSIYTISTKFPFYNGILHKATTSWASVYPVSPIDFFIRSEIYPYISFASTVNYFLDSGAIDSNSTQTPWFDIAYGYHHINQPGFDKAIYAEESDNSQPLSVYHRTISTTTCNGRVVLARNDCRDLFLGATYYDSAGVLRTTSSERFFLEKCFNDDMNDGCRSVGASLGNFLLDPNSYPTGRVVLELRVVGWQMPTTSYVCVNKEYIPRLRLSSWARPKDVFFRIGNYKFVTSTGDPCDTAFLLSKIQARFVVDPLRVLIYNRINDTESLEIVTPSSLYAIKNYLTSYNRDFTFFFKELGLALLSIVYKNR